MICKRTLLAASLVTLLLPAGLPPLAQQKRENARPPACGQYDGLAVPLNDLPADSEKGDMEHCNSEQLYFGFDQPPHPVEARKCAYIEREKGRGLPEIFGGAGLLAMIYANGKGAQRNFDLALKFACEVDGAPAENDGRFNHLLRLKQTRWRGDNFNLCDDVTSGLMMGWCANIDEGFAQVARIRKLERITEKWSPEEKRGFRQLRQLAQEFFETSSANEVDLTGTGRVAWQIEANALLEDKFVAALEKFERGQLPHFSAAEFHKADAELNAIYSRIQAEQPEPDAPIASLTPAKIRKAQRVWLRYREAWVKFGQLRYPDVPSDSWRTWLTQERIWMLDHPQ